MKTLLLHNATLLTLLLVSTAALAQGPGRHAGERRGASVAPMGLAYGAGYQARRIQQSEREGLRARQATTKTPDECAPSTTPPREPEPARVKEPDQNPAPARRGACAVTKP